MDGLGLTCVPIAFQWIGAVEGWPWALCSGARRNLASSGFRTLDPWPEVGSTKISVMRVLWCSNGTGQQEGAINHMGKGRYLYSLEYIPLVFSCFFLSNFQTLKFVVTLFLGTVRPRRLKLGAHVDSGQLYHACRNEVSAIYSSLYFFIFLSLQFSNIKIFRPTFLRNCEA